MIDFDLAPSGKSHVRLVTANAPDTPDSADPVSTGTPVTPGYVDALNDRQREAVLITDGPLIVLAGAGSGKTKMLTSRIAYLIEAKRVSPHKILAVTFTNKASAEMRARVERTLNLAANSFAPRWGGGYLGAPEIGTFHSVCVRLLRRELAHTVFTKPFVIYDDSDQLALVKDVMEKLAIDDKAFNPKSIQGAINRAKCDAIEPHEIVPAQHNIFERQVARVYEAYQKELFANNALDFGEIICMTYRLLRDNLDVRKKYQERFRYLHVDEYQDTNRSQYLLLSMIAKREFGGHENICVVGDEDQSIYKWRGADIRNILDFEHDFPGSQTVKLEQNYRSSKTIIKAASQVISNNKSRKDKTLWTDNEEGVPIVHAQVADERMEAEIAITEVKRLAQNEARAYGEFAIFYRTNAQSRQFEDVLRREKIPYQIVGGLRFYDRKEIKDVLSYFKCILNPTDSISLKRIINVPARGIGKTTIDKIDKYQTLLSKTTPTTYWDALKAASQDPSVTSGATAKKLAQFTALVERLIDEQPKLLLSELYHLILDETGYVRELRQEASEEADSRVENLEEFDTLVQEFEEDFFDTQLSEVPAADRDNAKNERKAELLPVFIEQSSLASDADRGKESAPPESTVKMMTLHSSKGLEFPVVFLVGMEEGLFPSVKAWEETPEEDIEEERRLCYVGMTRAREQLYLMNATVRRLWGNVSYQEPSRFFAEMPLNLIDMKDYSNGANNRGGFRSERGSGYSGSSSSFPTRAREAEVDEGDDDAPTPKSGDDYGPRRRFETSGTYGSAAGHSRETDRSSPSGPVKANFSAQSSTGMPIQVGQPLDHPEYGMGKITAIEGSGDDARLTIEFGGEKKKFILKYLRAYLS